MNVVEAENLTFTYRVEDRERPALRGASLAVGRGEFAAILGANGSGKSTFARHLNALLIPDSGRLTVAGLNLPAGNAAGPLTGDQIEARRRVGLVFQNPDTQFVSSIIYEDVAFALTNRGCAEEVARKRVRESLAAVGMSGYEERSPYSLSGGQKQRIALAGVLAADPEVLVFDEATSMLDPEGRREILDALVSLKNREGRALVMVTHQVDEAALADRVILMDRGEAIASGSPREIFQDRALLARARLEPPVPVKLYLDLREAGIELSRCPLTVAEFAEEACRLR